MTYALPQTSSWYSYSSKKLVEGTAEDEWVTETLSDLEQAVFVRAGSILPLMNHKECFSIIQCLTQGFTLEVYPDGDSRATGSLYVDDGYSFDYASDEANSAMIAFTLS